MLGLTRQEIIYLKTAFSVCILLFMVYQIHWEGKNPANF